MWASWPILTCGGKLEWMLQSTVLELCAKRFCHLTMDFDSEFHQCLHSSLSIFVVPAIGREVARPLDKNQNSKPPK